MPRKTGSDSSGVGDRRPTSMRPRLDAAENVAVRASNAPVDRDFNEAAARCRGKPTVPFRSQPGTGYFNEAAARCRGKRAMFAQLAQFDLALQ